MTAPERIAKRIARAGLCSRREAETWIANGRVKVEGKVVLTPATTVGASTAVHVDDQPLPAPEPSRLWRYHKPRGLITTARDPEGRPTIFDRLPRSLPRVMPVGRLDLNSEGLLLLTNDGEIKRRLELPETGWARRYRVRAYGRVEAEALARLARGVTIEGISYGPIEASIEHAGKANLWLLMALREGKNREVRRVCEHLGLTVNRLIRVSYGPFQLGGLPRGELQEVPRKVLDEQLGRSRNPEGTGRARAKPRPPKGRRHAANHRRPT